MKINIYPFELQITEAFAHFPFIFDGKNIAGIKCIISCLAAGDMTYTLGEINPARLNFFKTLGLDPNNVSAPPQNHTRNVGIVQKGEILQSQPAMPLKMDGLVTNDPQAVLCVTVADCLPVYLLDTANGYPFAVLHSGWKGTGIVRNALGAMAKQYQTKPQNVAAILGPCIRGDCYEVDAERAGLYDAEFGHDDGDYPLGPVTKYSGGKYYLDMQAANAHILAQEGVRNIAYCTNCTLTDDRLGSFRRQGAGAYKPSFTKMLALAGKF